VTQNPTLVTPADRTDQNLTDAVAAVMTEIGRTDTKASLLLAFNGAVIAGLAGAADKQLPLPCRLAGGTAIVTLAASAVLLLLVVRPRLGGADGSTDRSSFPYWAKCDAQQICTEMREDRRPDRIRVMSQIAKRKYVGLRRAIDLSLAATAFVVLSALTAL
jgi:hypothetical protein